MALEMSLAGRKGRGAALELSFAGRKGRGAVLELSLAGKEVRDVALEISLLRWNGAKNSPRGGDVRREGGFV